MPPIPTPPRSGFTTTTEVPLYWCAYGPEGRHRTLVLHGGPGADHRYLLPQMLQLSDNRELVFYDQRGGGQSRDDSRQAITARTHVEDLDRVGTELGVEPLTLIGYSWGGLLAMLFAIEAAARRIRNAPARLVLIDPAPVTRAYREQFEAEFSRRQASGDVMRLRTELAHSDLRSRDPAAY